MPELKIFGDSPTMEDGLGFDSYVDILLEAINNLDAGSSLTIGIHGRWGSGKTSLMKMLEKRFKGYLFSILMYFIDVEFEEDLNKGIISEKLKDIFNANGISLSSAVTVEAVSQSQNSAKESHDSPLYRIIHNPFRERSNYGTSSVAKKKEDEWVISDKEKFIVKKDDRKLNIYKDDNKVKTIWFNAWAHGREESIGLALLQQVLIEFQKDEKTKEKFAEFAMSFSKLLADAALRKTTGITFEEVKELFKNSIEVKSTLRADFENAINDSPVTRLVVFIDDLDRCLPEETIEILEVIKLFLDVPRCVFVIGVEKKVIEQGIAIRYKTEGLGIISGKDYIEKIIQVPFNLPPISVDDMIGFIKSMGISGKEMEYATIVAKGTECNPRKVKTFLNRLRIRQEIADKSGGGLKPAVAAKLLVIDDTFSEFYKDVVKYRKEDFLCKLERLAKGKDVEELRKELKGSKMISEAIQKYDKNKYWDLKSLLKDEPSFCGIDLEPYIYLSGKPPEEVLVPEESILDDLLSLDPRKIEGALSKIKANPKLVDDEIITKLKDDRGKSVRGKAAEALGVIKDPKAVDALIETLKEDKEASVRSEAAGALGRIGDKGAVEPLKEALMDRSPTVCLYAKNALQEISPKQRN